MKTVTIAMDFDQIRREIYAESACLALMMQRERPEIISSDHAALVNVYIGSAMTELVASLAGFIADSISLSGGLISQLPFNVPDDMLLKTDALRKVLERALVSKVLEYVYESDEALGDEFAKRYRVMLSKAKLLFAAPVVML